MGDSTEPPVQASIPPPRLWKLTGCGKLRATVHPPPDLPTTVGNPGRPSTTPGLPQLHTASATRDRYLWPEVLQDDNPPAHPRKLHPPWRTATFPRPADANAPALSSPIVGRPPQPPTRASSTVRAGRQRPPGTLDANSPSQAPSPRRGRQPPPVLADAYAPPRLRALVPAPEELTRPPTRPSSSVASITVATATSPCRSAPASSAELLHPLKLHLPSWTATSPTTSLTQTPPSPASPRARAGRAHPPTQPPELLHRLDRRGGRQPPPADWLRYAPPNCPPSLRPASAPTATLYPQGRVPAPELRPASRPPFLRRAHPISRPPAHLLSPHPRAPHRAVAFRSFPPPYGPGAARPWLRRGRRHPPTAGRGPVTRR